MIRRPPRSTLDRSSAASDVYKRQSLSCNKPLASIAGTLNKKENLAATSLFNPTKRAPVSYTHLRAHETVLDLVCRLLLEKKKKQTL